jgi:NADH-quinone oxidoreductase subunit L
LANLLARFDDRILDGVVDGLARVLIRASDRVRRLFEEPVVDGAVESLATAARAVGRLARRPQTGMLHQYYAQAVLVIVALLLVALIVR